jgi:uncharacterized protein
MRVKIDDAIILITGASAGIGYEFARQLAPRAHALILVARRLERLQALKTELIQINPKLQVSLFGCDLSEKNALEKVVGEIKKTFKSVDILINNAGMGDFAFYHESSWPKVEQMLNINIVAPAYLTREFLPLMIERHHGAILNVSSLSGIHFYPAFAAYVGSKHFMTAFTECLRAEASLYGVVISQLCPGPVATEFEQVAVSGAKGEMPAFLEISAKHCVRTAIRGLECGKALIVPGVLMTLFNFIYGLVPTLLVRQTMKLIAWYIRRAGLTQK